MKGMLPWKTLYLCRTNWKLKEIEKAQDGTYKLYYDTPDGSQKVRVHPDIWVPEYFQDGKMSPCACVLYQH